MSDHDHAHGDDFHVHPHVSSTKQNVGILMILFVLTGLTLLAYNVRLGAANLFVAILIASIKATFVGTFFMHLKYEHPLIWIYIAFPIILLVIMIGGLLIDTPTRYVPGKGSVFVEGYSKGGLKSGAKHDAAPAH